MTKEGIQLVPMNKKESLEFIDHVIEINKTAELEAKYNGIMEQAKLATGKESLKLLRRAARLLTKHPELLANSTQEE